MNINIYGKGALIQPLKIKDYRLELASVSAPEVLPVSYSLKDKIGKIKNQNGSGSCVGQSFAYYAELLNYLETGVKVELSARDLYSQNFVEPMGAYLKNVAEQVCKTGVVLEADAPSYENGNPPTEQWMRKRGDITLDEVENGKTYLASKYLTWDRTNVEWYKKAIIAGKGCVVACAGNNYAWANGDILVMDNIEQTDWWHAVLLIGFDNEKKCFEFVNSWGDWGYNGRGWLPYDYITKGYASNPITLLDIPNETYVKLISQVKNIQMMIIEKLKQLITILQSRKKYN